MISELDAGMPQELEKSFAKRYSYGFPKQVSTSGSKR